MTRAAASAALVGALVLAGVVYGGGTAAVGHGVLLLRTESNARLQQILLWHPSGGTAQPLGSSSDWILMPQWSPDGKSIAFAEERGGWDDPAAYEIWTMRADGKRLLVRTSRRVVGLWSVAPAGGNWRQVPLVIGKSNFDNCALSWR